MSLWECVKCRALRAVGLETCPQCGSADRDERPKRLFGEDPAPAAVPEQPAETLPVEQPPADAAAKSARAKAKDG